MYYMETLTKRLKTLIVIVAFILLIPLVAMQFSDEIVWNLFDFVVMGFLLLATGLMLDFTTRRVANPTYRSVAIIIVVMVFLLIWAELAVGVFGTPFAGS